jgi:hypothetical protein
MRNSSGSLAIFAARVCFCENGLWQMSQGITVVLLAAILFLLFGRNVALAMIGVVAVIGVAFLAREFISNRRH